MEVVGRGVLGALVLLVLAASAWYGVRALRERFFAYRAEKRQERRSLGEDV